MTGEEKLWKDIDQAGGIDAYITRQLTEKGFLVERRNTADMNPRQLKEYKAALRKEAEEKRMLKKEAWAAYKTSHIIYLGDGIYWQDKASEDRLDLKNVDERRAANELPQLDTPEQLANALEISMSELRWLAFHRDAAESLHYTPFEIPKRDGGKRMIWAPRPKLKRAQHWILANILAQLPVHGAAHGFLQERSILTNARVHVNSKRLIRMDMKDFFPTITFPRVKGVFRKAGYREQTATLLALLCTEAPREIHKVKEKIYYVAVGERCLPQGAPTSPALSNIVSLNLDRRLQGLCNARGWRYTRYADDMCFSLSDKKTVPQVGYLLGAVKRIVEEEGFILNETKTWVARKGGRQAVTGLLTNGPGNPRVSRELKRNLRAALHNLKSGKGLKEEQSIHQLIGYASFIAMVEPELGRDFLKALYPYIRKE